MNADEQADVDNAFDWLRAWETVKLVLLYKLLGAELQRRADDARQTAKS